MSNSLLVFGCFVLFAAMVCTNNDLDGFASKPSLPKRLPSNKERKAKDLWIGYKVKMKDHAVTTSPKQCPILGVDTFKRDVFGSIIDHGTKSPFYWVIKFGDDIGLLKVEDKKITKHLSHQKKPLFPEKLCSPPLPLGDDQLSISFASLDIKNVSKESSMKPSDQERIAGYKVASIKVTLDPQHQQTLSQIYGDPIKARPIIKTGLLNYAKNWNLYKQVEYVPTKKNQQPNPT